MVYKAGDQVKAVFQSACPRNNVRLESTFLTVERQDDEDTQQWEVVSAWIPPGSMQCPCSYHVVSFNLSCLHMLSRTCLELLPAKGAIN